MALIVALCALLPAVAWGGDEGDESVSTVFSLKASHGFRLMVLASNDGDDPGEVTGQVLLMALGHRNQRAAIYYATGVVTPTRLEADLGALGRIDLTLSKTGKKGRVRAPAPCNGSSDSYEKMIYRGSFEFRGEEGFTSAKASRISVNPQMWVNLVCSNHFEVESEDLEPGTLGVGLHAELRKRNQTGIAFELTKNRPQGRTLVRASVSEKRHGIFISHAVGVLADAAAFTPDDSLSTATVDLPAPFSGSAVYRRNGKRSGRLVGNLRVDLPGRANVPLTRPDLRTTLFPATWSVEPPEFR